MDERIIYDVASRAEERRRLVAMIPPPGPAFLNAALNVLRRAGIEPMDAGKPAPSHLPARPDSDER